jgi:membrane-associated phospholipid phosphatase
MGSLWRRAPYLVAYELLLYVPYLFLTRGVDVGQALAHGRLLAMTAAANPPGLYTLWRGSMSIALYELPHLVLALALPALVAWKRPQQLATCVGGSALLVAIATAAALAFPAAPPWYLWHTGNRPVDLSLAQLNSFPSFHVALAMFATGCLGVRELGWYPPLVCVVVVITGQHYPADVLGGLIEGTLCYLVASRLVEEYRCTKSQTTLATVC